MKKRLEPGPKPKGYRGPATEFLSNGQPVHARNAEGVPICGRKKADGSICQQTILSVRTGRCSAGGHGGSKGHTGHPIVHGKRSEILASIGIADKMERALGDPELVSHHENIAVLQALKESTFEGCQPPIGLWKAVAAMAGKLVKLCSEEEALPKIEAAIKSLYEIAEDGLSNQRKIIQGIEITELQRKHIESEVKRQESLETVITARQAGALIEALVHALKNRVTNIDERKAVIYDLRQILVRTATG